MYFFDYGNAFLLESRRAGANVNRPGDNDPNSGKFRFSINPSFFMDTSIYLSNCLSFCLSACLSIYLLGQKGNHSNSTIYPRYPSYVQDIMGDIFSLGFGPFRWVCTSGNPKDLEKTDKVLFFQRIQQD